MSPWADYCQMLPLLGAKERSFRFFMVMDKISLALVIIGALNWGGVGLFRFDTVAWICGGQGSIVARIIYTLVALAGIWCISLLFREESPAGEHGH